MSTFEFDDAVTGEASFAANEVVAEWSYISAAVSSSELDVIRGASFDRALFGKSQSSAWRLFSNLANKHQRSRYTFFLNYVAVANHFKDSLVASEFDQLYIDALDFLKSDNVDTPPTIFLFDTPKVFRASKELFHLYLQSVAYLRRSELSEEVARATSDPAFETEFSETLVAFIASVAQELRYEGKRSFELTHAGRWDAMMQIRICERFLVVPDLSEKFLAALLLDIKAFIKVGGQFCANWGKVILASSGDLLLQLEELKRDKPKEFKRAKRIE